MPQVNDYTYKLHKQGGHLVIFYLYRATTGDYPRYVQYINSDGKWYILRETEVGNVRTAEFYLPNDYGTIDTDWIGHVDLEYGRFDEVF